MQQYYTIFGQAYGSGGYDTSGYGVPGGASSSTLTNTGIAVAGIVTIAAVILLAAILVRIWKRPRQAVLEPAEVDDAAPQDTDVSR